MTEKFALRSSRFFTVAATAVGVLGISLIPAPTLPVAHAACDDWTLGPTTLAIKQDGGPDVDIYGWSGKQITALPSGKPAYGILWTDGGKTTGSVAGNITGKTVTVNANWNDGPGKGTTSTFVGDIGDDGIVRGAGFHSEFPAKCAAAQNPGAGPATPAKQTVTILQQSDVYDAANGGRIEAPFFLDVGRTLDTVSPCTGDWCLLAIPDLPGGGHGNLPDNQGFVYSGLVNGDNFVKVNG